jgi:hypothetical protein
MFRGDDNHARVEMLRFKVQRARKAARAAFMRNEYEAEIIATLQRDMCALQKKIDMSLVRLGGKDDDNAAACARVCERCLHGVLQRMVWRCKYAPVSWFGWTISPGQIAFDVFDAKLSDPLVNASEIGFSV